MHPTASTVKDIYCSKCSRRFDINEILNLCECGGPLLINYDYAKAATTLTKDSLAGRANTIWRYEEVLPVQNESNVVCLGEGGTELLESKKVGQELGLSNLYFKDESTNPTGSFKARGLSMAVSRAKELGIENLIIPTAGNAGSAVAAYAARAGMRCKVIMPSDVPEPFRVDCDYHGAEIEFVDGTIADCGHRVGELVKSEGWFSVATLKEPYRIEGKKTMGYELAEHFEFELPDIVIYPTGGGTGLIGMWKAFDEMEKLGWINSKRPRMVSVQTEGCAPIVRAFESGADSATTWENPSTVAAGLRVPGAVGDFLMLEAIRKSGGTALAVSDAELLSDTRELASKEGVFAAPEGGATLSALRKMITAGQVEKDERVVLFITGSGYKYLDVLK